MVSQLFNYGLSDKQLQTLAYIILNWSTADRHFGYCLNFIYGVREPNAQSALTHVLDMRKKIDLLSRAAKWKPLSQDIKSLIVEAAKVTRDWSDDRNYAAHGTIVNDDALGPQLHSVKHDKSKPIEELDRALVRSRYVVHVALRINLHLAGAMIPLGPLPDRPE